MRYLRIRNDAPYLSDAIWNLAEWCWVKDASSRLTANDACDIVSHLYESSVSIGGDMRSTLPLAPNDRMASSSQAPQARRRLSPCPPPQPVTTVTLSASVQPASAQIVKIIPTLTMCHANSVFCVAISPDGTQIGSGSADMTARVWDMLTGYPVTKPLVGHSDCVIAVTFSAHYRMMASAARDTTTRIWDTQTGAKLVGCLRGHGDWVWCVAFSPDSTRIATGSRDKTVRIWDVRTGITIAGPFTGHTEAVRSVSFSPHGSRVISGSFDKTIRVWDVQQGKLVLGPLEGHAMRVSFVAFSHDRMWLISASGDRNICVWDAGTGALVSGPSERLPKDLLPVRLQSIDGRGITISPNGVWVVTHSQTEPAKEIQVWNSETGLLEGVFDGHTDTINAITFSPDGRQIVSCSNDTTIRVCTLVR